MRHLRLLITTIGAFGLITTGLDAQDKDQKLADSGLVRASKVTGMDVKNGANENLGDIDDLVLDRDRGTIAYAVVSFGGFLGMGDKLFAVPWQSLKPTSDRTGLVLDIPKERLQKAPGFDKNKWPDMHDPNWANEVRRFYGLPAGDLPNREAARLTPRDDDKPVGARLDPPSRSIVVRNGTIKSFHRADPAHVVVMTSTGEVYADVGPISVIDEQRLTFDPDTAVTLKGYDTVLNGKRTFIVSEVTKDGRMIRLRREDWSPVANEKSFTQRDTMPLRDVTGTVVVVGDGACERRVTLRTPDGERVIGLGAASHDDKAWTLNPSETITVRGFEDCLDGQRVFVATEIRRGNDTWKLREHNGMPLRK